MLSDKLTGTVLVVDDDDGVRKVLARWVAEMGHTVKVAGDAGAALELMETCAVDVALCDVRMPGRDGIWLLDQVRRTHPSTAVVLATGLLEMDPMITLRPGVVGYIVKPFNREELAQIIQRGLTEHAKRANETASTPSGPRLLSEGILEGIVLSRS